MLKITNQTIAQELADYLAAAGHPLEAKQVKPVKDLIDDLLAGYNSGYDKQPTGTGKTVIFSAIITALKKLIFDNIGPENDGALIITDTVNAAEQAYETLTTKLRRDGSGKPLYGWDPKDVKIYYGSGTLATERNKTEALKAPILIMTLAAFYSQQNSGTKIRERRPIGIIDEVDASKGDNMTPFIRTFTQNNFVWGFSATDSYTSPTGIVRVGPELFGREHPFHETTIKQAAEQGQTSPVKNIVIVAKLDSGLERKIRGSDREYTSEENRAIIEQPGRDDAAIRAITEFVDPETGIAFKDLNQIWFCFGVDHANRIAARLNTIYEEYNPDSTPVYPYGYAVAVSGKTSREDVWTDGERQLGLRSILRMHKDGVIPVLANADLLIRSFDSPRTELAVIVRGSRSPGFVEQTGGRIDRLFEENPNKLGYVASFVDSDMAGALVFSDIAGSSKLGMKPGARYATINKPRTPHLERLNPDRSVAVDVYWEPRDIQAFFEKRRSDKAKIIAELGPVRPKGYLNESEFGVQSGNYADAQSFYKAVKTGYDAHVANSTDPDFSVGKIVLSVAEVGYFRAAETIRLATLHIHERYIQAFKDFVHETRKYGRDRIVPTTFTGDSDWFSAADIDNSSTASKTDIEYTLKKMVSAETGLMFDPRYPDHQWRIEARTRGKFNPLCVHKTDLIRFLRHYNLGVILKTNVWLTADDLIGNFIRGTQDQVEKISVAADVIKILNRLVNIDGTMALMSDPVTGAVWQAQQMFCSKYLYGTYERATEVCLLQEEREKFGQHYQLNQFSIPRKTDDWLDAIEITERSNMDLEAVQHVLGSLKPIAGLTGVRGDEKGNHWPIEERRHAGLISPCLKRDILESFVLEHQYDARPFGAEWLMWNDINQRLVTPVPNMQELLRGFIAIPGAREIEDFNYMHDSQKRLWRAKSLVFCERNNSVINYLYQDDLERFAQAHGFELTPVTPSGSSDEAVALENPDADINSRSRVARSRVAYSITHRFTQLYDQSDLAASAYEVTVSYGARASNPASDYQSSNEGFIEDQQNAGSESVFAVVTIGNNILDFEARSLKIENRLVALTEAQFLVLYRIVSVPDSPLTLRALSHFVGNNSRFGIFPQESTIANYVSTIRGKLRDNNSTIADSLMKVGSEVRLLSGSISPG